MTSTAEASRVPTGCYRCGRPGHWSKDCPANGGGTTDRGNGTPASGSRPSTAGGFSGGNSFREKAFEGRTAKNSTPFSKSVPKETIKKDPRKRPNLTVDMLLSENGLGFVLEKMPAMVTIQGREDTVASDLKSLLEGYMQWHSILLPYYSFDQFVDKVENLGSSKRVRRCIRELRDKIAHGKKSTGEKVVEGEGNEGSDSNDNPADTSGPEREADHIVSPTDEFLTNDEPEVPVTEEDFEDFFRQGVEEPDDNRPSSTVQSGSGVGLQSNDSPSRMFQSFEGEGSTVNSATRNTISESAAARMEANRLQALERAKARRANNVQL